MAEGDQVLIYDSLPIDGEDLFNFRMKKYNYLYLCNACTRSFETVRPTKKCIYCGTYGKLKELVSKKVKKFPRKGYLYHCEKCDRTFETNEETDVCQFCGAVNIDYYTGAPSGRIGLRDKAFSKVFGLFERFDKVKLIAKPIKPFIRKPRISGSGLKKSARIKVPAIRSRLIKMPKTEMPTMPRIPFPRLSRKKQEELPTK